MFCPRCGTLNNDENSWCIRCGNRLEIEKVTTENNHADNYEEKMRQPQTDKKREKEIKDYLVWSILATILGSLSFGAVALIFSGLTSTELASGDIEKAKRYSKMARMFCLISLAVGVVKLLFIILVFAYIFIMSVLPYYIFY